jgi:hypothetical protein
MTSRHSPANSRRIHKRLGIAAGIGIVWLALTGLAIVWSDNLGLPHTSAPGWISNLYGTQAANIRLISGDGHTVEYDGRWRFDGRPLDVALSAPSLLIAGPGELYYAVAEDGIALIAPDGTLVESVPAATLGTERLTRAGGNAQRLCAGNGAVRCTNDSAEWKPADADLPALMPVAEARPAPNMERVFLDLHAARFLGPMEKLLWTVLAVALLLLPWSGLRLALRKQTPPGIRKHAPPAAHIVELDSHRQAQRNRSE